MVKLIYHWNVNNMQLSLHPINNYTFFRFQLFLSVCQYDHHFHQNLKILSLLLWETEWLIGDVTTVTVTVMGSNSFTCSVPVGGRIEAKRELKIRKGISLLPSSQISPAISPHSVSFLQSFPVRVEWFTIFIRSAIKIRCDSFNSGAQVYVRDWLISYFI